MKKFLFVILLILLFCGCEKKDYKVTETKIKNNSIIVDVRTKEEYVQGHVSYSINIPYDQIDELKKLDKKKTIYVYCASGSRSKQAYDTLLKFGYDVIDLGSIDDINLSKE